MGNSKSLRRASAPQLVEPSSEPRDTVQVWLPGIAPRDATVGEIGRLYAAFLMQRPRAARAAARSRCKRLLERQIEVDGQAMLLEHLPVRLLRREHVYQVLWSFKGRPTSGNQVCRFLRAALNWAIESRLVARDDNPAHRFKPLPVPTRAARNMTTEQVVVVLRAMDDLDEGEREPLLDFLRLLFLLGLRPDDLRNLSRSAIDWSAATLSTLGKGGQPITMAIPKSAEPVLRRSVERHANSRLVFPGSAEGGRIGTLAAEWEGVDLSTLPPVLADYLRVFGPRLMLRMLDFMEIVTEIGDAERGGREGSRT